VYHHRRLHGAEGGGDLGGVGKVDRLQARVGVRPAAPGDDVPIPAQHFAQHAAAELTVRPGQQPALFDGH